MRALFLLAPVLVAMPARAEYPSSFSYSASQRRMDEITAKYPPLAGSLKTRDDVEDYIQDRDEYDQAIQRLTLDEMRRMRKDMEEERSRRELDDAMERLGR